MFEHLSDSDIDICFLTETWLRKGDTSKIAEIKDLGYHVIHQSRPGRGGGVAIAFKKDVVVKRTTTKSYKSFEMIEGLLKSDSGELLRLCCIAFIDRVQPNFPTLPSFFMTLMNIWIT